MNPNTKEILGQFERDTKSIDISNLNIIGFLDLKNFMELENLNCSHNQITEIVNLPKQLKILDCSFNSQEQIIFLPKSLIWLNLESNPIQHLIYSINVVPQEYPDKLIKLEFGKLFNKPVNNLPSGLKHLVFGNSFNQPVDNLPTGLISLKFNQESCFTQSVGFLPESLKLLVLGKNYNLPIDSLPSGLETLVLHQNYTKSLNCLSTLHQLTYLEYEGIKYRKNEKNFGMSLFDEYFGVK